MPVIHLTTFVAAPVDAVFDMSRHIGLHKISQQDYDEEAVSGTTSGLISKGEVVKWKAKHVFKVRFMTIKVTEMDAPHFFEDTMINGDFKTFVHKHHFKAANNGTIMIDELYFDTPYGFIGNLVNQFYLTGYLKKILEKRNRVISKYAETGKWKALLTR